jgi:hypothetical protein
MNFDPFFLAIESSALSTWIRESDSLLAFPLILTFHTVAMGFLAGTSLVIALRLLGFARAIPVTALERFFPILWISFWVNAVTGVLLLIAYPTKALTNPFFYAKLTIIGVAVALIPRLRRIVVTSDDFGGPVLRRTALLAITSVVLWAAAITFGRLLPYTYHRLLVVE